MTKVIFEIMNNSSGPIFRKFHVIFFQKIRNHQAFQFMEEICLQLIKDGRRVSRASDILVTIHNKSYKKSEEMLMNLLSNQIEL